MRLAAVALLGMVLAMLPVENKVSLNPSLFPLLLTNCGIPTTVAALERHKWKLAVRSLARMVRHATRAWRGLTAARCLRRASRQG